jgi:hypothetical protein
MGKMTINGKNRAPQKTVRVEDNMISAQIVVLFPKKSIGHLDLKPIQEMSAGSVCAPKITKITKKFKNDEKIKKN